MIPRLISTSRSVNVNAIQLYTHAHLISLTLTSQPANVSAMNLKLAAVPKNLTSMWKLVRASVTPSILIAQNPILILTTPSANANAMKIKLNAKEISHLLLLPAAVNAKRPDILAHPTNLTSTIRPASANAILLNSRARTLLLTSTWISVCACASQRHAPA